jgi:hypothetical protein
MVEVRWLLYALVLELASLVSLLSVSNELSLFITYLGTHLVASLLLASAVWALLPSGFRKPAVGSWALTFSLAFFVPVFGLVGILGGVLVGYLLPAVFRDEPFVGVDAPVFTPVPAPALAGFRQEDLKGLLKSTDTPVELRLQSMLTVRGMPTRSTGRVLRETLGDASDDVRLLAYGILDQKEKAITQQIDRAIILLESATQARRYRLYRRLAELYWELNFQDLVQGDIRRLALERASFYVDRALSERPDDAGMWLLRGRILLTDEELEHAEESFLHCRQLGLPPSRVNPWLAELALLRGQLGRVRELMTSISNDTQFSSLKESVQYWRDA